MGDSWTDELTDVLPQSDRKPPLLRRLWWSPWGRLGLIAGAVVIAVAGLVVPVKLVVHGWQDASTARGVGRGAGIFVVERCVADGHGFKGETSYTCNGVFTRPGTTALLATTHRTTEYGDSGDRLRARIDADGAVKVGSDTTAAFLAALWITYAAATAVTEVLLLNFVVAVTLGRSGLSDSAGFAAMGVVVQVLVGPAFFGIVAIGFTLGYSVSG